MIPPQGFGGGIRKLSELQIDTNKDWLGYLIKNLGAPVDAYDPIRKAEFDSHASRHAYGGADAIPARGIARSQLEYPTVNVKLVWLYPIGKLSITPIYRDYFFTTDSFADRALSAPQQVNTGMADARGWSFLRRVNSSTYYRCNLYSPGATKDHEIQKFVSGTVTSLGYEAVDLTAEEVWTLTFSCTGSSIKSWRQGNRDLTANPTLSATDTAIASGQFGGGYELQFADFLSGLSTSPQPKAVVELNVEGSGKPEDPYRPAMSKNLVMVSTQIQLPPHLYLQAKKVELLRSKGFTDDEIAVLLGDTQIYVDLDAVTLSTFEFHPDKAPTVIVTILNDNPYKAGAILRQIDFAKGKNLRVFSPPRDYNDAVALYNQLERDYPHWLAGKDNFAYQTLGYEIFDWMQNIDFYYGELLDHKTHYNQLKQLSDNEITNRLNELIDKLSRETALVDEKDKHIAKAKEIMKKGW